MQFGTEGTTVVIEFERNGKSHKSMRWTDDPTLFGDLVHGGLLQRLTEQYEAVGAVIHRIAKVERVEAEIALR